MQILEISQRIDTRNAMYQFGVDFSSDARVLALAKEGTVRLVWSKSTRMLMGMRGMGQTSIPAALEIRLFDWSQDQPRYHSTLTLFEGGRLSRARLLEHKATIDQDFGEGTTDYINFHATLLLGADKLTAWLAEQRAKTTLSESSQKLVDDCKNMTSFNGLKL